MNDNTPPNGTTPEALPLPKAGSLRLSRLLELISISRTSGHAGQEKGLSQRPMAVGERAGARRVEDICANIEKGTA